MSNRNLQSHCKSDKIKWVATGLAIFLIAVVVVGMGLQLFGSGKVKPSEWFKKDEQEQVEETEFGGGMEFEAEHSAGISLTFVQIPSTMFSEKGISSGSELAYKLTATVTPSDVENTKVTYAVAWCNGESTFAKDKSVSEYVTATQETDGALKATLTCKQAFGEKIILTCTSQGNPEVSATVDLHYKQRNGVALNITGMGNAVGLSTFGVKTANFKADFNQVVSSTFAVSIDKSTVYTKENPDNEINITKVVVSPTAEFVEAITAGGLSSDQITGKTIELESSEGSLNFMDNEYLIGIYGASAVDRNKLIEVLKSYSGAAYNIELYAGESEVADEFTLEIDSSVISGQKVAERLQFDKTEIVF